MVIKEIKKKQKKVKQVEDKKKSEKNLCLEEEGLEKVTGEFVEHEIGGPEIISTGDSGLKSGEVQQIQEPETLEGSLEDVPSMEKEQRGMKGEEVEKKLYEEREQEEEKGEEARIIGIERLETSGSITAQPLGLQRRAAGMITTPETGGFIEESGAKKYEAEVIKDRNEISKKSGVNERIRKYESSTH